MPLLDHFTEPVHPRAKWGSFHSFWAATIVRQLNHALPKRFFASINLTLGSQVAADVAERDFGPPAGTNGAGGGTAVLTSAPPAATGSWATGFPDEIELPIVDTDADRLVGVIEIVSPSNKDRPAHRRTFAGKCAAYLGRGLGVVVVDVVLKHHFNLHDDLVRILQLSPELQMPQETHIYATSYMPVVEAGAGRTDFWALPLMVGQDLPTLPFGLRGWGWTPLDLEASYAEACAEYRLP
jgi:hypothetical protein